MTRTFGLALVTALLVVGGTQSMGAEKPLETGCKDGASRQFDFWVGHWRVTEHGKPAGENVKAEHFIFPWQAGGRFVQVLSSDGQPSPDIEAVKPVWTAG